MKSQKTVTFFEKSSRLEKITQDLRKLDKGAHIKFTLKDNEF